jgi:hypothetical protein
VAVARTIIVVALDKGWPDDVEEKEGDYNEHGKERRETILVWKCKQETKSHSVEDGNGDIVGLDGAFPKLLLKLAESLRTSGRDQEDHQQEDSERYDWGNYAEPVEALSGELVVNGKGVRNVEAVEKSDSQNHLF